MRAGSLQREITEGRRDEKKGRGRARQKLIYTGCLRTDTENQRRHNSGRSGVE